MFYVFVYIGDGYICVFIVWQHIGLYTEDLCTFYILLSSQKCVRNESIFNFILKKIHRDTATVFPKFKQSLWKKYFDW